MDNNSWERTDGELRPTKNEIYKGSTFGTDDKINFMGIPWGDLSSAYRSTAIQTSLLLWRHRLSKQTR